MVKSTVGLKSNKLQKKQYTRKTSGLKIQCHLKTTEIGSKMLLLTRLWVAFG